MIFAGLSIMALFLSTVVNKIDNKGRVSIQAPFRSGLADQSFFGIVAFPSYQLSAIDACGIDRMEALSKSIDQIDDPDEIELASLSFAEAVQLAIDDDGRVVLPKKLSSHAQITNNILFVGKGPTFQMWNPENYEKHKKAFLKEAETKKLSVRLKPIPTSSSSYKDQE